jgi:hypothetical protein
VKIQIDTTNIETVGCGMLIETAVVVSVFVETD